MSVPRVVGVATAYAAWLLLVEGTDPLTLAAGVPVAVGAWALFAHALHLREPLIAAPGGLWLWRVSRYLVTHVLPDLVRSTAFVFGKVLARQPDFAPAILAVHLPEATPQALTILAYGIALTPVQQVVEIDAERGILYVHVLDGRDPDAIRAQILEVWREHLQEVTR